MSRFSFVIWLAAAMIAAAPPNASALARIDELLGRTSFAGPVGFRQFCVAHETLCAPSDPQSRLVFKPELWASLSQVQTIINLTIDDREEQPGLDHWQLFPQFGDCEDFVMSKYALLLAKGLSPSDMRVILALTDEGQYHAVLGVETDLGTIILDNRFATPLPLNDTKLAKYTWIGAQMPNAPRTWRLTNQGALYAQALAQGTAPLAAH